MLETDEVDIDYFTPAGSTSLASIFGKGSISDETKETPSLKYVPPPPPEKSKPEDVKPTQWIFTCVVHGFEWIDSGYISRGKLGLAILKIVKTNSHSIILYDSNKTTLSCATISSKFNIHIRDVLTISYYDNAQKYWNIKTSNDDMDTMLQLLKDLQATIVPKTETEREDSGNSKEQDKDDVALKNEEHREDHEVDTDFYVNQKTKDSILKRMANMGHSVLPPHGKSKGHASDSSDSNDIDDSKKNVRHKPAKIPPKRFTDLSIQENESNIPHHSRKLSHKTHTDGQPLVTSKSPSTAPCGSDMNVFISEQKISNSELRINVNRVSDKLDIVLERLNDVIKIDKSNSFTDFQNDIVQKLMREYESKIKNYEYIMTSRGIDFNAMKPPVKVHSKENLSESWIDNLADLTKINELQEECREKDNIIEELKKEIKVLVENVLKMNDDYQKNNNELLMEIKTLKEHLNLKNEEIDTINKNNSKSESANSQESCDVGNKVKKIMNDTYEAISANFDNKEAYSGEKIKAIIAIVIKKTTIQTLQEL